MKDSATDTTFILRAVAGSHAQGLATESSDTDYCGVFSVPSGDFWGLSAPRESIVHKDPDSSYHELRKFLSLCLKGNPTVLEVLAMDDYLEKEPVWGDALIKLMPSMLSAKAVRGSYLGYAEAQRKRLWDRAEPGSYKAQKLARHAFRLLDQGYTLYTTGSFRTKVAPEMRAFYFGVGGLDEADLNFMYEQRLKRFRQAETVLSESPDVLAVEQFLYGYRASH